jgi:hypothetical protein
MAVTRTIEIQVSAPAFNRRDPQGSADLTVGGARVPMRKKGADTFVATASVTSGTSLRVVVSSRRCWTASASLAFTDVGGALSLGEISLFGGFYDATLDNSGGKSALFLRAALCRYWLSDEAPTGPFNKSNGEDQPVAAMRPDCQFNSVHKFASQILKPSGTAIGWDRFNQTLERVTTPPLPYGFFLQNKTSHDWIYAFKPSKCNLNDCPVHVFMKPFRTDISVVDASPTYCMFEFDIKQKKQLPAQVQAADRNVLLLFAFHFADDNLYSSAEGLVSAVDEVMFVLRIATGATVKLRGPGMIRFASPFAPQPKIAVSGFSRAAGNVIGIMSGTSSALDRIHSVALFDGASSTPPAEVLGKLSGKGFGTGAGDRTIRVYDAQSNWTAFGEGTGATQIAGPDGAVEVRSAATTSFGAPALIYLNAPTAFWKSVHPDLGSWGFLHQAFPGLFVQHAVMTSLAG